jgi:hypothetical protein
MIPNQRCFIRLEPEIEVKIESEGKEQRDQIVGELPGLRVGGSIYHFVIT